jgi:hypothetical protein
LQIFFEVRGFIKYNIAAWPPQKNTGLRSA